MKTIQELINDGQPTWPSSFGEQNLEEAKRRLAMMKDELIVSVITVPKLTYINSGFDFFRADGQIPYSMTVWREVLDIDQEHYNMHRKLDLKVEPHNKELFNDLLAWFKSELQEHQVETSPGTDQHSMNMSFWMMIQDLKHENEALERKTQENNKLIERIKKEIE